MRRRTTDSRPACRSPPRWGLRGINPEGTRLDVAADRDAFVHRTQRDMDRRRGGPVGRRGSLRPFLRTRARFRVADNANPAAVSNNARRRPRRLPIPSELGDGPFDAAFGIAGEAASAPRMTRPPRRRKARRERNPATVRRAAPPRPPLRPTRINRSPKRRLLPTDSIACAAGRAAPGTVSGRATVRCDATAPGSSGRLASSASKPKPAAVPPPEISITDGGDDDVVRDARGGRGRPMPRMAASSS